MKDRTNLIIGLIVLVLIIFLVWPALRGQRTETSNNPADEATVGSTDLTVDDLPATDNTLSVTEGLEGSSDMSVMADKEIEGAMIGVNKAMTLKAYFSNILIDPNLTKCERVYYVERT